MKYDVLFERTETGYSAHVSDLPGCLVAGPTFAETSELIRRAIGLHAAGEREDEEPISEAKTIAGDIVAAYRAGKPAFERVHRLSFAGIVARLNREWQARCG